jgi:hypothetical protein
MKRITRVCNKCTSVITDNPGSILEAKYGEVARQLDEPWIDLCPSCSSAFLDWLRAGRPELPKLETVKPAMTLEYKSGAATV